MKHKIFIMFLIIVFSTSISYGGKHNSTKKVQYTELKPYIQFYEGKRYEYRQIQVNDLKYVLWKEDSCSVKGIDTSFHKGKKKKCLSVPESIFVDSVNYKVMSVGIRNSSNYRCITLPKYIHKVGIIDSKFEQIDLSRCDGINMDSYTILECCNLQDVKLPESLQCIYLHSFIGCDSLQYLKIPKNVKGIYVSSPDLPLKNKSFPFKYIEVDKGNKFFCSENGVIYNKDKSDLIYYPSFKEDSIFVVPNSVRRIGPYAFYYAKYLKRVHFHDSVYHIGHNAFEGCALLDSIWLPKRLVYVDQFSMPDNHPHIYFNGEVSFDVRNPVCNLHLTDGRVVRSTEYINSKPSDKKYCEYLSCDSVSTLIRKITEVCRTADFWDNGWFEGDSSSWKIIKCGKEIIPCLISLIGDTTQVAVSQSFSDEIKTQKETVSTIVYGLLSGMVSDFGELMYEKHIYGKLFTNYRLIYSMDYYRTTYGPMREFLFEWYEKNKNELIWVNSLGFYEKKRFNPAGGYYILRKK